MIYLFKNRSSSVSITFVAEKNAFEKLNKMIISSQNKETDITPEFMGAKVIAAAIIRKKRPI